MLPLNSGDLAEGICSTVRPEFCGLSDLLLLFAHAHSGKTFCPISFNISFVHEHSTKI